MDLVDEIDLVDEVDLVDKVDFVDKFKNYELSGERTASTQLRTR